MYIKFLSITKTLRFRILFPLMLIILSVSFLEIYYLNHYAFTVVEDIVLDTKAKNASQVLNGIERYFSNIETIAKKPLNTIEISSLLRKDYTNLSMFREIMLPNPDIESSLIYDTSEKDYYAISDTYALYKDSYYSFNAHDTDFSKLQATDGVPFISGIKKSNMLVQPHDDYIVTYGIGFNNHFKTENSLYGAFYINIKASAFAELCSRNYVENTGDCYLLDQNDHIVFCEQKDLIGTDICDSFPLKNQLKNTTASAISDKQYVYTLTNVSDTTGWRVATISNTSNVFSYRQTIFYTILLSMMLLILIITFTIWMVISNFTKPITTMKQKLLQVSNGDLQVTFENSPGEIGEVNGMIQHMLDEINHLIKQIYHEENVKRELQLHSLQNQITPHFIYNTLSRLKWMAAIQQADSLAEALGSFSDILSYCMKSTDYFIELQEEITFLTNYIKIMNLRMLNEVQVHFEIPEALKKTKILRFLIQPIIENVFLHAFQGVEHECLLAITAKSEKSCITFYIEDNGIGMSSEQIAHLFQTETPSESHTHSSIALNNVQQRIQYHYGSAYGITVQSTLGKNTIVVIQIPY